MPKRWDACWRWGGCRKLLPAPSRRVGKRPQRRARIPHFCAETGRLVVYADETNYQSKLPNDLAICGQDGLIPFLTLEENPGSWNAACGSIGIVSTHSYNDAAWMGSYIQRTFNIVSWGRQLWITEHGMAQAQNDPRSRRSRSEDSLMARDTCPKENLIMSWHRYTHADLVGLDVRDVYCHR